MFTHHIGNDGKHLVRYWVNSMLTITGIGDTIEQAYVDLIKSLKQPADENVRERVLYILDELSITRS